MQDASLEIAATTARAELAGTGLAVRAIDMRGARLEPADAGALPAAEAGWLTLALPVGLVVLEATTWADVAERTDEGLAVTFVRPGEAFLQRLHHYLESAA